MYHRAGKKDFQAGRRKVAPFISLVVDGGLCSNIVQRVSYRASQPISTLGLLYLSIDRSVLLWIDTVIHELFLDCSYTDLPFLANAFDALPFRARHCGTTWIALGSHPFDWLSFLFPINVFLLFQTDVREPARPAINYQAAANIASCMHSPGGIFRRISCSCSAVRTYQTKVPCVLVS